MRSARGSWAGPRIPGEIRPEFVSTTLMGDEAGAADPQPVGAELEEIWDCAEEAPARRARRHPGAKGGRHTLQGKSTQAIALAFLLPAVGIVASTIGFFAVNTSAQGKGWDVHLRSRTPAALSRGAEPAVARP